MAYSVTATVLSNQDATPASKVYPTAKGGSVRASFGNLSTIATTVGQTMAFMKIPARARIVSVNPYNVTLGNGSIKLGFYRPGSSINTAVAVKDDAITTALALTAQTGVNAFNGPTPANRAKAISDWLATEIGTAGATQDVEFDIVATVVTVSTGASTDYGLEVTYVLPE